MPLLDYLILDPIYAVVLGGAGVFVRIPDAARFAFHKLWVSQQRPLSEQTKARKDLLQAEQLLEVLLEDRPGDLERAWTDLLRRSKSAARLVHAKTDKLSSDLQSRLAVLLDQFEIS